ncbi:MAG: aminomethyl-transferring glycine dehydrogenase subunit GcvPA [Planctomycetes bacterium]|nr:aminomethyl-transferring glycine dehydrogenase subunit GcvPA [Planctomycetota bacterium]NOG54204.1 aminomethyl-transferring glycine dehydrogenase subunit GcvPA [Planctomycetota bacterium]
MNYTQITPLEREEMLEAIGVAGVDELFSSIHPDDRLAGPLNLPPAASELELQNELNALAEENSGAHTHACFMGAGSYDHFIPTLIDQVVGRGEFLTAYTPYQAEASQGALQAFFEFQTQVAGLAALDVANASLYDGATAVAEAAMLAVNVNGRRRVLVASTVHPDSRAVLRTYFEELPVTVVEIPAGPDGIIDPEALAQAIDNDTACVIVQSPNFHGLIEDWNACFEAAHSIPKTLGIAVFNPIACGLLNRPGECGADVAVAEGQPLGTPLQFGGPYLGLFAAKNAFVRKMPGRLVGETVDTDGRRAFCLTLQTREQHIRREKATSNICTNQGLLALRATVFLNTLGPQGLAEMAEQSYHKAHYLATRIAEITGFALKYPDTRFFNEFVVTCPAPAAAIIEAAVHEGFLLGPPLDTPATGAQGSPNDLLICATEKRSRAELDSLVEFLAREYGLQTSD